ncbi:hypothetical protein BCR35DRAFT_298734 [Leucosporidium creatinivorum]|uniref:Uncharacterized protein n=1 Tax=Leucosporidium creatinivorum TaxID=106004 RepID=A0A1Y2G2E6_9BASI|nr:hypothetical protein BCR35DRAFT_298734 [Leucosporidium creatinivorum]
MSSRWHTLAMSHYTTHLPPSEESYSFHRSTDEGSTSNSPELPRFDSFRSSSLSSSASSSDGIRTPPLSPNLPSVADTKRLIVGVDEPLPFSWDDEVALQQAKEPLHPISPFRLSAPKSLAPPPPPAPKPAPAPSVTLNKPRKLAKAAPAPPPPTREYEEARRGRSRWPRLLWNSEVDQEALGVLEAYHQRAVGGPLPVLKSGASSKGVRKWSDEMEKAGL